ncbi:MAG TPA: hypothetical protein VNG95_05730, partial [Gemmatimonadales bacterium]|nr:hypothetical protein [Gemmatimonadales bacterium]
ADIRQTPELPALDRNQLVTASDSFRVVVQGNTVGYKINTSVVTPDSMVFRGTLDIGGGTVHQDRVVRLRPSDLTVAGTDIASAQQGRKHETHLTYGGGRVRGTILGTPDSGGAMRSSPVDTTMAAGSVDKDALEVIIPALPLTLGRRVTLGAFDADSARTTTMQVRVAGMDTVTVPAGKFAAMRVAITGAQTEVDLWVTIPSPRRIVKIEYVGSPVSFELVK